MPDDTAFSKTILLFVFMMTFLQSQNFKSVLITVSVTYFYQQVNSNFLNKMSSYVTIYRTIFSNENLRFALFLKLQDLLS